MVAQNCLPQVQACAVRVARLQQSGLPEVGADTSYISDTMVNITLTPVYEDGDAITDKNACGTTVVDFVSPPSLKRADVSIEFIESNPFLADIFISGGAVLTGAWGSGWAYPSIGVLEGQLSIELWSKRINNGTLDATFPYARWAIPFVKNVKLGERSFQGPSHMTFTGEAYENTQWFDGPANDWPAASDRVAQWIPVNSIPAADCTTDAVIAS